MCEANRMNKIFLILMLLILSQITGCMPLPRIYLGADDVHGWVVDAETKEPIQDVVVLGVWKQYDGYYGSYSANLVMRESYEKYSSIKDVAVAYS